MDSDLPRRGKKASEGADSGDRECDYGGGGETPVWIVGGGDRCEDGGGGGRRRRKRAVPPALSSDRSVEGWRGVGCLRATATHVARALHLTPVINNNTSEAT